VINTGTRKQGERERERERERENGVSRKSAFYAHNLLWNLDLVISDKFTKLEVYRLVGTRRWDQWRSLERGGGAFVAAAQDDQ